MEKKIIVFGALIILIVIALSMFLGSSLSGMAVKDANTKINELQEQLEIEKQTCQDLSIQCETEDNSISNKELNEGFIDALNHLTSIGSNLSSIESGLDEGCGSACFVPPQTSGY